MSNTCFKAFMLTVIVSLAACDGDGNDCAEKVDKFAQCVDDVRKDKDIQDLINKKFEIFKGCGAKDTVVKCMKSKIDCASKALDTSAASPTKKDSVAEAEKCFEKKDLFEGMEMLFMGMNQFGHHPPPPPFMDPSMIHNGMPPPPPPPMVGSGPDVGVVPDKNGTPPPPGPFGGNGPPPPPGAVNGPMPPFPGHHGPPVFFLPDECDLRNVGEDVEECTIDKLFNKTEIVKLVNTLKDKLKSCKKALPDECKVRPEMLPCLLDVFKPTIKVAMDTYKDCMTAAGYKVPELPPMPPMMNGPPPPLGGNAVGESKDKKSGEKGDKDKKKSGEKGDDKKAGSGEAKNSTSHD